jgi:DNA-binding IclR family transcriptional regulator
MKKEKSAYSIQSVDYALDVLEQFLGGSDELGVSEVSRRLGLNKNLAFRLLATLTARNYLEQNRHTDGYRLGLKNVALGQSVIRQMKIHRQARPVLEELVRACNETADVSILRGTEIYCLDSVESDHPVRALPRIGSTFSACRTAAGKVLLSAADPAMLGELFASASLRYASRTFTVSSGLQGQLETIAAQEYALEDGEMDAEVRAVAAPIRDYSGGVVGAVSIFGPIVRFGSARLHGELIPLIRRAGEEISGRLGHCAAGGLANIA